MAGKPEIEFFFDCSSPWTWLAFHNIRPLARELNAAIDWRPVLVGGIFNAVNDSVYRFRESGPPAKHAYMAKDLADWARQAGLSLHWPPAVFPVNSVTAMRLCLVALPQGRLEPVAAALFEAYWRDDRDISQPAVIAEIAAAHGIDPAATAAPEIKQQLRANTGEVIARGGFGSPTIFVGGDDMYFGNDRLGLVRDAVLRRRAAS